MLKEFVEAISQLAVDGAGPQIKDHDPYEPSATIDSHGNTVIDPGLPRPRKHVALDLGTIAEFAKRFDSAAIWYSRKAVVALIDDNDRKDTVRLEMTYSEELLKLMDLQKFKPWFDQRAILTFLRTVFTPAALPMHTTLINDLRVVKFDATQTGNSEVIRGKSSVGKTAMAKVEGWDQLPEVVTLAVPVLGNAFIRQRIEIDCALEVNEQEQRFQLFPLPGEVEMAIAQAETLLRGMLTDLVPESTAVYYGEP